MTTTFAHTEALRFWSELSTFNYVPLYFSNQFSTLGDTYSDLYSLDQFTSDLETYIQDKLGYATTADEIAASFDEASTTQLSFWQGTYFLFDPTNQLDQFHVLAIAADGLTWDSQPITTYSFAAGTLTFSGSLLYPGDDTPHPISGTLAFVVPPQPPLDNSDGTTPDPVTWLEQRSSFQRYGSGTVTIDGAVSQVHGKEGCYTPQGAGDDANCDPINYWNGIYNASIATDAGNGSSPTVVSPAEGLTVSYANGTLSLNLLGGLTLSTYTYFNNSLSWETTTSTGQLVFYRTLSGLQAIAGSLSSQGQTTYIQAFYRQAAPAPATLDTPLAAATVLDNSTGTLAIAPTTLPLGVSNRNYSPQTLKATGGTTPYSWSSSDLPPGLTLTTDGQLSGIPTSAPGTRDFHVTVTDSSSPPQMDTALLTLKLVDSLSIKTTSLPDAVTDQSYFALLTAQGGDPSNYQWELTNATTLGNGLSLDASGKISGQVSSQVNQSTVLLFTVKVTSTVGDISLDSEGTFTIKLTNVYSPALITSILTGVLGLLFGSGLILQCRDRYQKWKEGKAKADAGTGDPGAIQTQIDTLQAKLNSVKDTAAKKTATAKTDTGGINDGTLLDKVTREYDPSMILQLKTTNETKITLLQNEIAARKSEIKTIKQNIDILINEIQNETDGNIRLNLERQRDSLLDSLNFKENDIKISGNEIIDTGKKNDNFDGIIKEIPKIDAL